MHFPGWHVVPSIRAVWRRSLPAPRQETAKLGWAVRQAVAGFQAIGEPVPELLQSHVLEAYTAGVAAKRGPSKADRFARNAWIKLAVNAAMAYGLDRTRNNASSNRPCACSVVKEVLDELRLGHLTERALEDISK
jgi:hypothetical protein